MRLDSTTIAGNLARAVDRCRNGRGEQGVGNLRHYPIAGSSESTLEKHIWKKAIAGDLAGVIDCQCKAEGAAKGAEVVGNGI